jgi:antirestriction protein
MATSNSPAVYVGTYHKYNIGSLFGAWMKLDEFNSRDEFIEAALKLHKDEEDPELMFQDWEHVDDSFISESYIEPEFWDWLALDDDEQELLTAYREEIDSTGTLRDAENAYITRAESFRDYADELADELLHGVPDSIARYFDYEAFARDLEFDYTVAETDGGVIIFAS